MTVQELRDLLAPYPADRLVAVHDNYHATEPEVGDGSVELMENGAVISDVLPVVWLESGYIVGRDVDEPASAHNRARQVTDFFVFRQFLEEFGNDDWRALLRGLQALRRMGLIELTGQIEEASEDETDESTEASAFGDPVVVTISEG